MSMDRLSAAVVEGAGKAPLTPLVSYLVVCAGIILIAAMLMVLMASGKRSTNGRKLLATGLLALGIAIAFGGLMAGSPNSIFAQDPTVAAFATPL